MKQFMLAPILGSVAGLILGSRLVAGEPSASDLARQLNQVFVETAEKVSPSVVVITVRQKPIKGVIGGEEGAGNGPDALPRDLPRQFLLPFEDELPEEGQGSGIVIRKDGHLLTNAHVLENADRIQVRLRDGRNFTARVIGVDEISDVAVIKIDADNLPVPAFADSSKTRVGEFAVAIGAPFNYEYSVTFGHVSAKGRANVIPAFEGGWAMDQDFIQTDANINPGNSGGPLLNLEGEVIGINTVIRGLHTGIGFAIPANLAREISDRLIAEGKFTRTWLGVGIRSLRDSPEFRSLVRGVNDGAIVQSIMPDGPAARSDLRPSDIITALDGKPVATAQQVRAEMRHKRVGQAVTLDVFREGRKLAVKVVAAEWHPAPARPRAETRPHEAAPSGLGITVHPLTAELAEQFGVSVVPGVIVVAVDRNSPAARRGIKPGDIITRMDQQAVASPEQFRAALEKADLKKGLVVVVVSREGSRFEILKEEP